MAGLSAFDALTGMKVREEEGEGMREMFPSSAVAQSHVPGSDASIGTLQQPPSHHPNSHHQRTSSIYQPPFDLSDTQANNGETRVPAPDAVVVDQQNSNATMVNTSTATDTAMMPAHAGGDSGGKAEAKADKAVTNIDQTPDSASQAAAVRKIR